MFAMQAHTPLRKSLFRRHRFELPTIGVAIGVYGGFVSLTWFFTSLPLWAAAPLGATSSIRALMMFLPAPPGAHREGVS